MTDTWSRRGLLARCSAAGAVCLAGCTGGEDDTGETGAGDSGEQPDGTDDDEADRADSGADDQRDDSQTTTADPEDVELGDLFAWTPRYVVDMTFEGDDVTKITQTVHEEDYRIEMELADGNVLEAYQVDGETYEVIGTQCVIRSEPEAESRTPAIGEPSGEQTTVSATEATTIDGQSVYVFDIDTADGRLQWYISADTGYPVRLETPVYTARFHSWDETDPISAPEMSCREA